MRPATPADTTIIFGHWQINILPLQKDRRCQRHLAFPIPVDHRRPGLKQLLELLVAQIAVLVPVQGLENKHTLGLPHSAPPKGASINDIRIFFELFTPSPLLRIWI